MASWTTNLGLRKPALTDNVNVASDINGNMDIIDSAYGTLDLNKVSSVVITERVATVTFTSALNAHSGASLTSLGGSALSPNVPSGYTFVGNVNIAVNGLIGVSASFDGNGQHTSTSVTPYLFNASNGNFGIGATCTVRLYSLCIKK